MPAVRGSQPSAIRRRYRAGALLLGLVLLILGAPVLSGPATAQVSPSDRRQANDIAIDQSVIIERFKPPLRRPPTFGLTISGPAGGVAPSQQPNVQFFLKSVELVGNEHVPTADLAALWQGLIGRNISLAELATAAEGVDPIYRKHDYYGAAVIPPQDFSSGHVRILIYEGFIRDVVIEGGPPDLAVRLHPYIVKITGSVPLRVSLLQRYLLLITDLAGITLNAELSKIEDDPGAGRLVLKFSFERQVLQARLDNFGPHDTGNYEAGTMARFNDVFGTFESTNFLAVTNPLDPTEVVFLKLAQDFALGPSGLFAGYELGHIWANPLDDDDIHAETTQADVYLNYAILRSVDRNLSAAVALNSKDVAVDVNGESVIRQRSRWLTESLTYDDTILGVSLISEASLAQGLPGLDSNGPNADFQFATINADLSRDITEKTTARLLIKGQYAFTNLPSTVRFDLGGETYGRAFEKTSLTGESGLATAFEVSHAFDVDLPWLQAFSVFAFVDYGEVWNNPGQSGYGYASLGSVGAGFRSQFGQHFNLTTYVATAYKAESSLGVAPGTSIYFILGARM